MTIDDAIRNLESAKRGGTKSIILAWWSADMFDREDNDEWEHAAEVVEDKMDWSATHSDLHHVLDLYTNE
jgi:hypothetical protein